MESIRTVVKQYAVLTKPYSFQSDSGDLKFFSEGDDLLLGGKYGYEYDLEKRGVIVKISELENHLIPESFLRFEEETETISINRKRTSTSPP